MKFILEEHIQKNDKKLYEDSNIKIININSEESIKNYTSNYKSIPKDFFSNGSFHVVFFKKADPNNKFSKIFIYVPYTGLSTWIDAFGNEINFPEQTLFKKLYPKLKKSLEFNFNYYSKPIIQDIIQKFEESLITVVPALEKKGIFTKFEYSSLVVKNNNIFLKLKIYKSNEKLDEFLVHLKVLYNYSVSKIEVVVKNDEFQTEVGLYFREDPNFVKDLSIIILRQIMRKNQLFLNKLLGYKTWVKVNSYSFKKNEGLIKQLVDYLDTDPEEPTKYSFLENIGYLKSRIVGSKKEYSRQNTHEFLPASHWRGQYSDFFNAASAAGIIKVSKKSGVGILSKGPNFEEFKKGKLKPIS